MAVKDELKFAQQGFDLLDQKRTILISELMLLVDRAALFEESADAALAKAHKALERSILGMGRMQTSRMALAVTVESSIVVKSRKVMGVALPVVETTYRDRSPYYSPVGASVYIDEAIAAFREALSLMGRLAEMKISIMRLAGEVKRTIRKVNALEKVAIPNARDTLAVIQDRLEEAERDMFVLMKSVKKSLEPKEDE